MCMWDKIKGKETYKDSWEEMKGSEVRWLFQSVARLRGRQENCISALFLSSELQCAVPREYLKNFYRVRASHLLRQFSTTVSTSSVCSLQQSSRKSVFPAFNSRISEATWRFQVAFFFLAPNSSSFLLISSEYWICKEDRKIITSMLMSQTILYFSPFWMNPSVLVSKSVE